MNAPSGVVTFLFTDIEGSTRRWEADAEAMRDALQAHDGVLREAVAAQRGWLFKHTGDGVCAAFSSPSAAVEAAVAAQRGLELPVRMGIATGEAELREGDYFGPVLNRAARVMAAGHGGQILLEGATALLVNGFDLVELGPRRLRDLAQSVELFQVRAPGLRANFPPPKTLDPTPGNLRAPTTTFVGREAELSEVPEALRARRLVTLTGVGGVGKTRLAFEVARRVENSFPDGVWVIEFAAISDPAAVPDAVAAVLGIKQQPAVKLAESIATALEGRSRLLVFDNCEHVVDAAAELVDAIFSHSSTVKILATSREGLAVGDEQLFPVPSLDVQTGVDSTAASLFIDRAHDVAPHISLSGPDESTAVAEICRRLDGIPLAIELAASRMQSMTATEVRDRLDDLFRLLVGSRRGLERHQTLRHAVQWSYDLLDDAEKHILAVCSVFAGGFDLSGACAVTGAGDEFATLDLLDALVRKSLLIADRSSGRTRFSMLETIRQFSEEQLVASGAAEEVRLAHARYFAGREEDLLALWDSPRERGAYTWFTVELPNLRTAFRWAADHDDLDSAAPIAVYATFLGMAVEQYEPLAWTEELIEPAREIGHGLLAQLYALAAHCCAAGRIDDALHYSDAGRAAIETGDFDVVSDAFKSAIGAAYMTAGQPERWVEWCRASTARTPGSQFFTRGSLIIALVGADDEAMALADSLVAEADITGNPTTAAFVRLAYGLAYRDADPDGAYNALRQGLTLTRQCGSRQLESALAARISTLAASRGDPTDALDYLSFAIRTYDDSGSFSLMRGPMACLADVFDRLGRHESAATLSAFAITPFTRTTYEIDTTISHLREVLGDQAYEACARSGLQMTNAAMAAYALDEIAAVRSEVQP